MTITQRNALMAIFIVCLLTIIGAFLFQWAGYEPCHLCLMQRWAYYAVIPLSLAVLLAASRSNRWARYGFVLAGLVMIASAIFGGYHAGVEWGFWPGPSTCTGEVSRGIPTLSNEPVIGCDEAAIRILGISLAGWNAVISFGLAAIALIGARKEA